MSNKSEPFIEEWELYAKNPNHDLIEKCLKLAQMLEYPELNISEYVEKINSIGTVSYTHLTLPTIYSV